MRTTHSTAGHMGLCRWRSSSAVLCSGCAPEHTQTCPHSPVTALHMTLAGLSTSGGDWSSELGAGTLPTRIHEERVTYNPNT